MHILRPILKGSELDVGTSHLTAPKLAPKAKPEITSMVSHRHACAQQDRAADFRMEMK